MDRNSSRYVDQRHTPTDRRRYRNDQEYQDRKNHADLIERLIIDSRISTSPFLEGSTTRRQQSPSTNSQHSRRIDKILDDENNDWFFEKILEKFDDIRSRKVNRYERSFFNDFDQDQEPHGVERIVERRYYVKKPRLTSKRNQLTSTSDLTATGNKIRQHSGVSTFTGATTVCSQCLSTTPTYVDDLRDQSDTLRNEITGLKNDIEQLQVSQQQFFQQLQRQLQSKADSTPTTSVHHSIPSRDSPRRSTPEKSQSLGNLPVPLSTGRKSRSISTESQDSSSSSEASTESTEIAAPSKVPAAPPPPASFISEFVATKNPSIAPAPSPDTVSNSKLPPKIPTPPATNHVNSKFSSIVLTTLPSDGRTSSESSSSSSSSSRSSISSVKKAINLNSTSAPSNSLVNRPTNSKPSSAASTPPVNGQINRQAPLIVSDSVVNEQTNSKSSSAASTPLVTGQINRTLAPTASNSLFTGKINSTPPSTISTPLVNTQVNPTPLSMVSIPIVNTQVNSNPSSITPTPSKHEYVNFKPLMMSTTPTSNAFRNLATGPAPLMTSSMESIHSRNSSVAPVVPMITPSASATRVPIYENELAYRRVLSPRSQIVASSGSIPDSSDSSSGSVSPELIATSPRKTLKAPETTLHAKDLNDLVQYSSQLELSGFTPSMTPLISNPNEDHSFWNSVEQYIENTKPTNVNIGLPPIPRSNNNTRSNTNMNTTKRLDKYDLEIRPQEFIEFSAPLLMPPLDSFP